MKRKLYMLFLAAFLLLGAPLSVCASVNTEGSGDRAAPELYYLELSKGEISFARPGLSERLYVTDYADADYPYSGVDWKSDDSSVATVSEDGVVRAVGCGECTITAASRDAAGVSAECLVTVEKYAVTYHYKNGQKDKNVYYENWDEVTLKNPKRSGYTFSGWYTDKACTRRIRVIAEDNRKNYELYALWKKVKKPGKPSVSVSSSSAGKVKITIRKKVSGASGYEIWAGKNKSMTAGKKTVRISGTSKTLSGLTAGARYFVKVRAYTSDSTGTRIYGAYSAVRQLTVKKAAVKKPSSSGGTVYVTRTGDKYHRGSCRYLRQSKIAISKSEAKKQGYTPCKVCKP